MLSWLSRSPGIATGQDDVEYITLSHSIRQGGYADLMRIDAPVHAQYPPGYPAVLAMWGAIAGDDYDRLLVLSLAFSLAALLLLFCAIRKRWGHGIALGTVAVLAFNPHWNAIAGSIRSEMPYVFLAVAALLLAAEEKSSWRTHAGAIAAAIGAALTRSVGITLVVAVGLYWMYARRWRTAAWLALAAAVTIGPWMLWTTIAPEQRIGSSYVAEIRAIDGDTPWTLPLATRIPTHARWYLATGIPHNLAAPSIAGTPVDNAIVVAIIVATALVGASSLFRRWRAAAIYVLVYAGLLTVWLWSTERFVIPVLPFIVLAMLLGACRAGRIHSIRSGGYAAAVLALMLATNGAAKSVLQVRELRECRTAAGLPPGCLVGEQGHYFEAMAWIEDNLPADAVFLTAKNGALYWYTERRSVSYAGALAQDSASFLPWIRDQGGHWILLSALEVAEGTRLARLLAMNCTQLEVEAQFSSRTILFRIPDATPVTDRAACVAMERYRADRESGQADART
jgi:MFS family permease